jgi:hypothetical protein
LTKKLVVDKILLVGKIMMAGDKLVVDKKTGGWQQIEEQLEGNDRGLINTLLFGVTSKNHKNIIQDRRFPERDSNSARTKHKR